MEALKAHKKRQAAERLAAGEAWHDNDLVFCHPDGQPYHPERASREFDRMVERLGVRRVRLHDLRHGGRAWAEGVVDGGATFYFSIPKQSGVINGH